MLCHVTILMGEQLLRVRQVARIRGGLRPTIAKLKADLGELSGLVEPSAPRCKRLSILILD